MAVAAELQESAATCSHVSQPLLPLPTDLQGGAGEGEAGRKSGGLFGRVTSILGGGVGSAAGSDK